MAEQKMLTSNYACAEELKEYCQEKIDNFNTLVKPAFIVMAKNWAMYVIFYLLNRLAKVLPDALSGALTLISIIYLYAGLGYACFCIYKEVLKPIGGIRILFGSIKGYPRLKGLGLFKTAASSGAAALTPLVAVAAGAPAILVFFGLLITFGAYAFLGILLVSLGCPPIYLPLAKRQYKRIARRCDYEMTYYLTNEPERVPAEVLAQTM